MATSISGYAILGAGIFAKEAHLPALATLGDTIPELKAVYSRSLKSASALASAATDILKLHQPPAIYHDGAPSKTLDALLARSDIAAVLVILPITLQPSIVVKALAAGKHVLSEKPVAPDTKQGIQLINTYLTTYKPKGLTWRVAENFEAEPGYRAAGAAIAAGKIGKVAFFTAKIVNYIDKESKWYKTPWRTIPDYQGGFLLDGGVHTIAALRVMLPNALTHLSGFASLNKDYLAPHDTIHAILQSQSNFHGTLELTFAQPTKSKPAGDSIVITGTEGWLSVNQVSVPGSSAPVLRVSVKSVVKVEGKPDEEKEEVFEEVSRGVEKELSSFFAAIGGQDDGLDFGNPLNALVDVAVIQAGLNSNGALVSLLELVGQA